MKCTNSPQTAIEKHTNSELSIEQVDSNKSVPRMQERCLSGNDSQFKWRGINISKRQEEHPIAGSKKEINAEEKRLRGRRERWKAAKRTQQQELYFVAGVFWSPNGKNRYSHAGRYLAARPHHDPSALLMLDGRLLWNGVSRCLRVTKPRVPTALCHNNFLAAHRLSYSTMDVCMVNAWNATNRDINR